MSWGVYTGKALTGRHKTYAPVVTALPSKVHMREWAWCWLPLQHADLCAKERLCALRLLHGCRPVLNSMQAVNLDRRHPEQWYISPTWVAITTNTQVAIMLRWLHWCGSPPEHCPAQQRAAAPAHTPISPAWW